MSTSTLGLFLRHLALSEEVSRLGTTSDRKLLAAYESEHSQAAFTELMRRYGPMVLRTCRRVLGHGADAEDAFQATFIMLARRAGPLQRGERSLGGWLHHVAYRIGLNVLRGSVRRGVHERRANIMTHPDPDPSTEATWNEIRPILDAELDALPDEARRLLIACYLQEKTYREVEAELGLPRSSVARHLERARGLLARRLARRGITVSAALLAILLEDAAKGAGVPAVLLVHTVEAARRFTQQVAGALADNVARLVKGGLAQMTKSSRHFGIWLAGWVSLVGAGLIACQTLKAWPDQKPQSEPPTTPATERSAQEGDKQAHTNRYGDPLPSRALARLGTVSLRHATGVHSLAFTRDGKGLITAGEGYPARLWDRASGRLLRQFGDSRGNQVYAVALSPDGRILAGRVAAGGLSFWDVETGKLLRHLKAEPLARGAKPPLAFSPDGKTLASVDRGTLRVWETTTGKELWGVEVGGKVGWTSALTYAADSKTLVWGGYEGDLHLYDAATGKESRRWDDDKKRRIWTLAAAPDGRLFAPHDLGSIDDNRLARLWDMTAGKEVWQLPDDDRRPITVAAFSPDGKILATGSLVGPLRLWDAATGKELRRCPGCQSAYALAFAPDGKTLASGDQSVHLWDVSSGREIRRTGDGHEATICSVSFTSDGQNILSSSPDGSLRVWDAATGKERRRFFDARAEAPDPSFSDSRIVGHASSVSPDGKTLISVVSEGKWGDTRIKVRRWNRESGRELSSWSQSMGDRHDMVLSPDGKTVACVISGSTILASGVHLWEATRGKELSGKLSRLPGKYPAFSPDGQLLAAISAGGQGNNEVEERSFTLWEIATGKKLCSVEMPENPQLPGPQLPEERERALHLLFSPDGRMLATISCLRGPNTAPCIRLWPLLRERGAVRVGPSRLLATRLTQFLSQAGLLAFSPDGRTLALPGENGIVRLLETATGKERGRFTGHSGDVAALSFAPDGHRLASGSSDTTILVWDVTGHLQDGRLRPLQLSAQEIEKLWEDLAANDAGRAGRAIWMLAAAPAQAVPYLRERLRQSAANTHKELAKVPQLLRDLDNDAFAVRKKARAELVRLSTAAEPALRQALAKSPTLEVRRSLEELLKAVEEAKKRQAFSGESLRTLRALEVLEHIGSREARAALKSLTVGAGVESSLAHEARIALERLDRAEQR